MSPSKSLNEALPEVTILYSGTIPSGVGIVAATQGTRDYVLNTVRYRLPRFYKRYSSKGALTATFDLQEGYEIEELLAAVYAAIYLRMIAESTILTQYTNHILGETITQYFVLSLEKELSVPIKMLTELLSNSSDSLVGEEAIVQYRVQNIELGMLSAQRVEEVLRYYYLNAGREAAEDKHLENATYYLNDSATDGRLANLVAGWIRDADLALHQARAMVAGNTSDPEASAVALATIESLTSDMEKAQRAVAKESATLREKAQRVIATFAQMEAEQNLASLYSLKTQIIGEAALMETARNYQILEATKVSDLNKQLLHELKKITAYSEAAKHYVLIVENEEQTD